jgi:aminopeptidase N
MRPDSAPARHTTIRLADYTPPVWLIDHVKLDFRLGTEKTRVLSEVAFRLNPDRTPGASRDLRLDGELLDLKSAAVNGAAVSPSVDSAGLTVDGAALPDTFDWAAEVEIDPASNKALEGLYLSNGMFCTQCEAEGFRKITFFPDRPDVMAPYEVRVEADKATHPVLLSNGERMQSGEDGDRHWALWRDPHPKPCYLFALVAGDLVSIDDTFKTMSGKTVDLQIFVRPGDEDKCDYAMDSLKRSMTWDEEAYGREYDLPLFMIVAVDDFNMGAMENKGLNIFNTRLVLASPETATDANFLAVESVIAHEYFHNWTGNRITCRDWFQLCLKEGLTVFRDQKFSEDMRSADVLRIKEIGMLRARQFREDAGPLAHPVRPEEYIEINNFYTATIYEKGAEVIRMLHTLVGPEAYRKATDLYFERHDGEASTIEQFRQCFEDATGRDLTQFARWWSQAGTPRLSASIAQDGAETILTLRQETKPTPGQEEKHPLHMPVSVGFLSAEGEPLQLALEDTAAETHVLELTEAEQSFRFVGSNVAPIPSILRGFSAPVILEIERTPEDLALLLAHDTDAFNRYEAGRDLALRTLDGALAGEAIAPLYPQALATALVRGGDPAFLSLLMSTPSDSMLADHVAMRGGTVDPDAIAAATKALNKAVAEAGRNGLIAAYTANATPGAYSPDAASAGKRAMKLTALERLSALETDDVRALAERLFRSADNMTDSAASLAVLIEMGGREAEAALAAFHERWQHDPLVLDKWLMLQARAPGEDTLERVKGIRASDAIDWTNPNRFRSLIGAFAANHHRFHAADGSGYAFFAEQLEWLDAMNPQTTARMATAFETWRRFDEGRQTKMRAQMQRLVDRPDCSRDLFEILTRVLG